MKLPIKVVVDAFGFATIVDADGDTWFESTGNGESDHQAAALIVEKLNDDGTEYDRGFTDGHDAGFQQCLHDRT